MKATVGQTLRRGRSDAGEIERQQRQVRAAINQVISVVRELTTASSNTLEALFTSDELPPDASYILTAKVQGVDGAGVFYALYEKQALFNRPATGAAAQLGATRDKHTPIESDAALDCQCSVSGSQILVKVLDGGLADIFWKGWIELRQLR